MHVSLFAPHYLITHVKMKLNIYYVQVHKFYYCALDHQLRASCVSRFTENVRLAIVVSASLALATAKVSFALVLY